MTHHDTRFEDIETKISFQEHLLENLNEALTSQQRQLDDLKRQMTKMTQMLESPQNQQISNPDEEAPPPHY
ncbi:MAG: hypothetical protein COW19_05830 [Zetaproteobacteria bacterium CG12_big_fil_rev_8_21_14_0_65_55_1124]|nr:MAG: hypothetical protein AUJ58_05705 [Zetaproteobacteria bacterium CG1_02_55_237]PIS19766.1 MAG: hypothetical protein COT53_03510 [Zetaproteobacteria bacterium CG08_land_8_20_14_0_20_55_17]PIW42801.1 MAG: hypothetical protein COW19_05830 [Zetaproteobacteria bacterium CG12_big_fil_rev_8_21_14_0_65_55_1124]PIY51613.1 MAG: hypothetical protein COZ01_10200 [Zetaproteobacteria bacterium CG_4_10_14_0_8_um_filter_55_43]PIZ39786.1 MAG: hypothetical protein COY36_01600 [Zetaproteobacteria bacterium 